jgi:hypothetical protein
MGLCNCRDFVGTFYGQKGDCFIVKEPICHFVVEGLVAENKKLRCRPRGERTGDGGRYVRGERDDG